MFNALQTGAISRIGQGVQNDQPVFGVVLKPIMNKIRTDESGTAGNE
jgi:hypothetical protein